MSWKGDGCVISVMVMKCRRSSEALEWAMFRSKSLAPVMVEFCAWLRWESNLNIDEWYHAIRHDHSWGNGGQNGGGLLLICGKRQVDSRSVHTWQKNREEGKLCTGGILCRWNWSYISGTLKTPRKALQEKASIRQAKPWRLGKCAASLVQSILEMWCGRTVSPPPSGRTYPTRWQRKDQIELLVDELQILHRSCLHNLAVSPTHPRILKTHNCHYVTMPFRSTKTVTSCDLCNAMAKKKKSQSGQSAEGYSDGGGGNCETSRHSSYIKGSV